MAAVLLDGGERKSTNYLAGGRFGKAAALRLQGQQGSRNTWTMEHGTWNRKNKIENRRFKMEIEDRAQSGSALVHTFHLADAFHFDWVVCSMFEFGAGRIQVN